MGFEESRPCGSGLRYFWALCKDFCGACQKGIAPGTPECKGLLGLLFLNSRS